MAERFNSRSEFATEGNLLLVLHEARFAGGVAASGQRAGFGGNLFTRDTCRMLLDTMDHIPSMAREMLATLPQMQGVEYNDDTNEYPDALPHQVFRQITGGRYLPSEQVENVEFWTDKWDVKMKHNAVDGKWFAVYNSSDAPPLYLITLAEYCRLPDGPKVLRDSFVHKPTGEVRTVGEAGLRCVEAIMKSISRSEDKGSGLYIVPNTNPKQTSPSDVMRDGCDSYYYPEGDKGKAVDFSYLAYIDNQALAYEALILAGTELYPDHDKARQWLASAEELRQKTLNAFWMERQAFFSAAVDAENNQVQLESSAAAELLNGPFLHNLENGPDIIRAIVRWVYDKDVLTPIGPRMLHKKFSRFEGEYYPYQGSGAVWPNVNGIIAKGLRKHGLYAPSYDLGVHRTLGWFNRTREAIEVGLVERETNQPCYHPYTATANQCGAIALAASELGQLDQGWAATAGLREIWDWQNGVPDERPGSWQQAFSRQIMEMAQAVPPASAGEPDAPLYIDLEKGEQLKAERAKKMGLSA